MEITSKGALPDLSHLDLEKRPTTVDDIIETKWTFDEYLNKPLISNETSGVDEPHHNESDNIMTFAKELAQKSGCGSEILNKFITESDLRVQLARKGIRTETVVKPPEDDRFLRQKQFKLRQPGRRFNALPCTPPKPILPINLIHLLPPSAANQLVNPTNNQNSKSGSGHSLTLASNNGSVETLSLSTSLVSSPVKNRSREATHLGQTTREFSDLSFRDCKTHHNKKCNEHFNILNKSIDGLDVSDVDLEEADKMIIDHYGKSNSSKKSTRVNKKTLDTNASKSEANYISNRRIETANFVRGELKKSKKSLQPSIAHPILFMRPRRLDFLDRSAIGRVVNDVDVEIAQQKILNQSEIQPSASISMKNSLRDNQFQIDNNISKTYDSYAIPVFNDEAQHIADVEDGSYAPLPPPREIDVSLSAIRRISLDFKCLEQLQSETGLGQEPTLTRYGVLTKEDMALALHEANLQINSMPLPPPDATEEQKLHHSVIQRRLLNFVRTKHKRQIIWDTRRAKQMQNVENLIIKALNDPKKIRGLFDDPITLPIPEHSRFKRPPVRLLASGMRKNPCQKGNQIVKEAKNRKNTITSNSNLEDEFVIESVVGNKLQTSLTNMSARFAVDCDASNRESFFRSRRSTSHSTFDSPIQKKYKTKDDSDIHQPLSPESSRQNNPTEIPVSRLSSIYKRIAGPTHVVSSSLSPSSKIVPSESNKNNYLFNYRNKKNSQNLLFKPLPPSSKNLITGLPERNPTAQILDTSSPRPPSAVSLSVGGEHSPLNFHAVSLFPQSFGGMRELKINQPSISSHSNSDSRPTTTSAVVIDSKLLKRSARLKIVSDNLDSLPSRLATPSHSNVELPGQSLDFGLQLENGHKNETSPPKSNHSSPSNFRPRSPDELPLKSHKAVIKQQFEERLQQEYRMKQHQHITDLRGNKTIDSIEIDENDKFLWNSMIKTDKAAESHSYGSTTNASPIPVMAAGEIASLACVILPPDEISPSRAPKLKCEVGRVYSIVPPSNVKESDGVIVPIKLILDSYSVFDTENQNITTDFDFPNLLDENLRMSTLSETKNEFPLPSSPADEYDQQVAEESSNSFNINGSNDLNEINNADSNSPLNLEKVLLTALKSQAQKSRAAIEILKIPPILLTEMIPWKRKMTTAFSKHGLNTLSGGLSLLSSNNSSLSNVNGSSAMDILTESISPRSVVNGAGKTLHSEFDSFNARKQRSLQEAAQMSSADNISHLSLVQYIDPKSGGMSFVKFSLPSMADVSFQNIGLESLKSAVSQWNVLHGNQLNAMPTNPDDIDKILSEIFPIHQRPPKLFDKSQWTSSALPTLTSNPCLDLFFNDPTKHVDSNYIEEQKLFNGDDASNLTKSNSMHGSVSAGSKMLNRLSNKLFNRDISFWVGLGTPNAAGFDPHFSGCPVDLNMIANHSNLSGSTSNNNFFNHKEEGVLQKKKRKQLKNKFQHDDTSELIQNDNFRDADYSSNSSLSDGDLGEGYFPRVSAEFDNVNGFNFDANHKGSSASGSSSHLTFNTNNQSTEAISNLERNKVFHADGASSDIVSENDFDENRLRTYNINLAPVPKTSSSHASPPLSPRLTADDNIRQVRNTTLLGDKNVIKFASKPINSAAIDLQGVPSTDQKGSSERRLTKWPNHNGGSVTFNINNSSKLSPKKPRNTAVSQQSGISLNSWSRNASKSIANATVFSPSVSHVRKIQNEFGTKAGGGAASFVDNRKQNKKVRSLSIASSVATAVPYQFHHHNNTFLKDVSSQNSFPEQPQAPKKNNTNSKNLRRRHHSVGQKHKTQKFSGTVPSPSSIQQHQTDKTAASADKKLLSLKSETSALRDGLVHSMLASLLAIARSQPSTAQVRRNMLGDFLSSNVGSNELPYLSLKRLRSRVSEELWNSSRMCRPRSLEIVFWYLDMLSSLTEKTIVDETTLPGVTIVVEFMRRVVSTGYDWDAQCMFVVAAVLAQVSAVQGNHGHNSSSREAFTKVGTEVPTPAIEQSGIHQNNGMSGAYNASINSNSTSANVFANNNKKSTSRISSAAAAFILKLGERAQLCAADIVGIMSIAFEGEVPEAIFQVAKIKGMKGE